MNLTNNKAQWKNINGADMTSNIIQDLKTVTALKAAVDNFRSKILTDWKFTRDITVAGKLFKKGDKISGYILDYGPVDGGISLEVIVNNAKAQIQLCGGGKRIPSATPCIDPIEPNTTKEVATNPPAKSSPQVFKKYKLRQNVDIESAPISVNCIIAPCPTFPGVSFHAKKDEIVMGALPAAETGAIHLTVVRYATIYKESFPENKVSVDPKILQEVSDTPLSNITSGASSAIGNLVTTSTGKIVGGIILLALFLGLLKWRKVI